MGVKFDWTADVIARLQQLVEQGLTAHQIAEQLGPGVLTRNAVIGKAHREKLKLQTPPHGALDPERKARERSRSPDAPIMAFPVRAVARDDRGVPYLQLERWHCKALLEQRGKDGLPLCCGRQRCRDANGSRAPYCAEHLAAYTTRAYVPRHRRI